MFPTTQEKPLNPNKRWQMYQGEKQAHATGLTSGKSDAAGSRRVSRESGNGGGTPVSNAAPAGKASKEGMSTAAAKPSRLQETLHR